MIPTIATMGTAYSDRKAAYKFTDVDAVLFDMAGTLVDYPLLTLRQAAVQCTRGIYASLIGPEGKWPPAVSMPGPAEAHARRRPAHPDTALMHRVTIALSAVAA